MKQDSIRHICIFCS